MTPDEANEKLVKLGSSWAELNAAAEILESTKNSIRSQLTMEYLPVAKSIAKASAMAEASVKYIEHLHCMAEARKYSNIAKVNYDSFKVMIDLERTRQANTRAEMNLR